MNDPKEELTQDVEDTILAWVARRQVLLCGRTIDDLVQSLVELIERRSKDEH